MSAISKLRSRLSVTGALAAACLLQSVGPSSATTTTTTFTATITLAATCLINSASALNFGSAGVLTANVDQTSTIAVQCTNTTPYNIGLDAGTGTGATVAVRKLSTGGATVNYTLYSDSGRTTIWGNTVSTDTVADQPNGGSAFGGALYTTTSQTTPAPGTYTDTVTVTVTY